MKSSELIKEIDNLGLAEKILLVEDIRDSIAKSNNTLPLPEWQKTELDKRYTEYKNGDLKLRNWQAVHENLREEYK